MEALESMGVLKNQMSYYSGVMGVPITFLDKYCPDQFEIVNANDYRKSADIKCKPHGLIKDKEGAITHTHTHTHTPRTVYARICTKRRVACARS